MGTVTIKDTSLLEKNCRKVTNEVLKILPQKAKFGFTSIMKRIRAGVFGVNIKDIENIYLKLIRDSASVDNSQDYLSDTRVVITHDVDSGDCYESIGTICNIERECGIRSTFLFLTGGDYKIDNKEIADIKEQNFNIGLHGLDHDIALAYRKTDVIKERLKRALDFFPFRISMYRSPALSISRNLLYALAELGIEHDSSVPFFSPYYGWSGNIFPYKYSDINIIEMPLTLADDFLFRDCRLSDQDAFDFTRRIFEEFMKYSGVFVFNGHPGILREHLDFYRLFLNCITK